jgi:DNA repair protein RadC
MLDHRVTDPNSISQRFRSATKLVSGQHDAFRAMLVHNHPSGDPKPSRDDIEMTKKIAKAAEALGIAIHDHLVIGRKGHASFRSLGLLC